MKKLLSVLLVLALAVSVCVMSTSIATPVMAVEAVSVNVPGGSFSMNNAIDYNIYAISSAAKDDTEVLVWIGEKDAYTVDNADEVITNSKKSGQYYIYTFAGIAAKKMADVFYCAAHTVVDGVDYYSNVKSFSFTRYAKSIMEGSDIKMADLAYAALEYGAAAQVAFNYNTDLLANTPLYIINVEGGALANGAASDYYYEGQEFTLVAPETNEAGEPFNSWTGNDGSAFATATATVVASADVTYTANYGAGLVYEATETGYKVTGYDGVAKTRIVVPATHAGSDVTAVAAGAFTAEDAAQITFVSTTVEIEDGAVPAGVEINGYAGSTAETYSVNSGNDFNTILAPQNLRWGSGGGRELLSIFTGLHPNYASHVHGNYDPSAGMAGTADTTNMYLGHYYNNQRTRYYFSTHDNTDTDTGFFRYALKIQLEGYVGADADFSQFGTVEVTYKVRQKSIVAGKQITFGVGPQEGSNGDYAGEYIETNYDYTSLVDQDAILSIPVKEAFGENIDKVSFIKIDFNANDYDPDLSGWTAETLNDDVAGSYGVAITNIVVTSALLIEA